MLPASNLQRTIAELGSRAYRVTYLLVGRSVKSYVHLVPPTESPGPYPKMLVCPKRSCRALVIRYLLDGNKLRVIDACQGLDGSRSQSQSTQGDRQ
jgi:hypothetical protein